MSPRTTDAVVSTGYGPVRDVLRHERVEVGALRTGEVLVRTEAVSLNAADVLLARGEPLLVRAAFGWRRPRQRVRGRDLAGVVTAVGPDVVSLKVGDRVAGESPGSLAREVRAPAHVLAVVPDDVTGAQAAAVPLAGVTALQAVRLAGDAVRPGARVLVTGAAGGVGSFVVQLLRAQGAEVTGESVPAKADAVRALGAWHVARGAALPPGELDVVVDVGGGRPLASLRRATRAGGTVVLVTGRGGRVVGPLARIVAARLLTFVVPQRLTTLTAHADEPDVAELLDLVARGTVRPLVGSTVPFERAVDAFELLDAGTVCGKVVVTF
ncbi:NAD(P)-dependent alcohol dehydrogenase [Cellulomonas sp. DKR-3]|uniref:NAD(P)-dependent alcohol dehydrogenase n=1 Tax=Cellulomonas fulva TaxID=2835530 RepID=A0ABS5TY59_9CELL|nr:NAD(P)-dependent alcohol dehydrogenase [Cellulomonas fulva]MBT0994090.1 NAD(P)-dependent alcohol dehydrogenase [Cellulomonas fulva]